MVELILGGARSGKSGYAERLALESGLAVIYIATAEAGDEEMRLRIEEHRRRRPEDWLTVEAPLHLATSLRASAAPDRCVIVDCLTLWLSNLLHAAPGPELPGEPFARERQSLLDLLPGLPGKVLLVSNEVGSGVIPMGEISRIFADEAGRLHQAIASMGERVVLMVAGYPVLVKGA